LFHICRCFPSIGKSGTRTKQAASNTLILSDNELVWQTNGLSGSYCKL
jgi:hypothetical protein